ncbi:MAG: hypothetical protein A2Y00_01190 [Omnitrophica WOR_2 bacterium GWF2_43_52]|nr:MAG: hypothetical protein A2Y00_01190 [Omnitrophica WOR_2 bacterium GWF2_43_52]HAH20930.1 hypothetical protein [Candidatus Omnitrophota bacterium]
MFIKFLRLLCAFSFLSVMVIPCSFADEPSRDSEIAGLKAQLQQLMQRIEKLEVEQTVSKEESKKAKEEVTKLKETSQAAQAGRVDLANTLSKLKIKGRAALGFFDSGKAGSYPAGSFEVPDAKLQFGFQPDDINTLVLRFNLNNATSQSPLLDYFFLQSKDFIPALKESPFSLSTRLGRFKLGFGEETWTDNLVEGIVPSNSAARATVVDEGLEFAGKVKLDKIGLKPLGWSVSVSDGNTGVGSDSTASKAFMGKLYHNPIEPLYVSGSYYNSGELDSSSSEMSLAGVTSAIQSGMAWRRSVWELDARYDFGKGKKPLEPIVFSDSKAIVRLSYGEFKDDGNRTRSGNFGFVDGIYNLTKKFYAAGRYSFIDMNGDVTATLNSVTANRYDRFSLGGGYHWSDNVILKLSYDWNKNSGPSVNDADDNLLSALVATQF